MSSQQYKPEGKKRTRRTKAEIEADKNLNERIIRPNATINMTGEDYKDYHAEPSKKSVDLKSKDQLARERREKRKEALKRPGAYRGQRLWAPQVEGYEFRWVIDQGGRIDFVEGEGYYFVEKDMFPGLEGVLNSDAGQKISQVVNNKDGKPTRQYLMVRPADIREESTHEKEERLRRRDEGLVSLADNRGIGQERTSSGRSAVYDPTKGNSVFEV